MNKQELISLIAKKAELTKKDAEIALIAVLDSIIDGVVIDGNVKMIGFGTFDVVERAERTGRNPKTSEKIVIPARKSVKFKVGKEFKDTVNAK